jgi:hypothetical protein
MTRQNDVRQTRNIQFQAQNVRDQYVQLFGLEITHTYYTENDGRCPDFTVSPTPSTRSLMTMLGIAYRADVAGFSVFIQRGKVPDLLAYLRKNQHTQGGGTAYWARLTFSMSLRNPLFVNITALPIDTKTTQVNLYGCNTQSQRDRQAVRLTAERFMGAEALYPVVPSELTLRVPEETARVTVSDIAGEIVIPTSAQSEADVMLRQSDSRSQVTLNLRGLPYDLYTISLSDAHGAPIETDGFPRRVLYSAPEPDGTVLLDFVFTAPTIDSTGIYPIPSMFDGPVDPNACGNVRYQLAFDARSTYWQYFVVAQQPESQLDDLTIYGSDTQFDASPDLVALPNGRVARVFSSSTPLPMRQKSKQRFSLSGQRRDGDGQQNVVTIDRLPVASNAPVWPASQDAMTGRSEIFVYV